MTPALNTESKKKTKLSHNSLKTLSQIHQMDSQSKTKSVPFCKFCFDSGKPEEIVHSHWIKDKKDGKPCCPTLAATKCGYCKAMGHTPKFCPRLASRDQRRKIHEARMAKRNHQHCGGTCVGDHMGGVQKQMKQLQLDEQKRKRLSLGDNAYAALINSRDVKRTKVRKTKPAPVWNGPKASAPRAPQGAWGKAAKAVSVVKDMTADEVSQLKVLLAQMGIFGEKPFAAEAAAAQAIADEAPSTEQQAWLEAQISKTEQSAEETAAGEAFFDNDADAEDAVMALADAELPPAPKLVRQSAFGAPGLDEVAPLPRPAPMRRQITTCSPGIAGNPPPIALPDTCDLDADFGTPQGGGGGWGDDGWGSD